MYSCRRRDRAKRKKKKETKQGDKNANYVYPATAMLI